MTPAHRWRPIEDLPANPGELTTGELDALYLVWKEQQESLQKSGRLEEFNQMLAREWSIETGIIEGVYNLDRGRTEILIKKGIDAELIPRTAENDPLLVAAIIQDHQAVLEGLFAFVKGERDLTVGYIKEIHQELLRHVHDMQAKDQFGNLFTRRLAKGSYKTIPNSPTRPDGLLHEYCPPEHVAAEMDRMILLHEEHIRMDIAPEIQAAWLHHAFTQIHPFEDGNGRVARSIATLVFLKAGWFPLVITRNDPDYLDALAAADLGDLKPLISLFVRVQRRSLMNAMEVVSRVKPVERVEDAIAAVRAKLVVTGEIFPKEWNRAKGIAGVLLNMALHRLSQVSERLGAEVTSVKPGFQFPVESGQGGPLPEGIASKLRYIANVTEYHSWTRLTLGAGSGYTLLISFHGLGAQFRGLLAGSAFLLANGTATLLTDDYFAINYKEDADEAVKRFQPWLEAAIVKGLTLWNQQL